MPALELTYNGRTLRFEPGQTLRVGREAGVEVPVVHELVSRVHATISYRDGWVLADNGSTNGIYHAGEPVQKLALTGSQEFRLGDPETGPALRSLVAADETRDYAAPEVVVNEGMAEHTQLAGSSAQPYRSIPRREAEVAPGGITIGSAPDNSVVITGDVFVSRHHARVTDVPGGASVDDLNSLNGTFVNGQLVSSAFLRDGDRLTVGNHDFVRVAGQLVPARQAAGSSGLAVRSLGFALANGKRLLHDIDLDALRGTLTAVIGPSGAGKSTFSRVVTGATEATEGVVQFDELDIHRNYDAVRTRVGLVPQEDVLHRTLKVHTALNYAACLRLPADVDRAGRDRQVERATMQLGLQGQMSTRVDKLSGGQRKRASVALELLTEPSLLVLDEPTSGLDPALDLQVMQTLRELADGDRAVLVITHSVAYLDICDQVLLLAPGGLPAYLGPAAGISAQFGTDDWAVAFARVAADPNGSHAAFRQSQPALPALRASSPADGRPSSMRVPWVRQFTTLAQRQLSVMFSDLGYLAFLVGLPIILGLMTLVVPGDHGFTAPSLKFMGEPSQLLALLVVGACFIGSSMSIRDLVSERPIFFRERAVGLSASAYVLAKIVVFAVFAWGSAAILALISTRGKTVPSYSLVTHSGTMDLFLALGLVATCSALLGLAISSLVRSSEQAMPLLVVILMAQLVLHGGLIPVTGRAVLDQISWLIPARWGFAAAASSIDLQKLVPSLDHDPLWGHTLAHWWGDAAVLVGFSAVFGAITWWRLRRSKR